MAHISNSTLLHLINKTALNTLFFTGLGGFIAQSLEEQLFRWLRAAELTCDRAALLVAQDPKVCKKISELA